MMVQSNKVDFISIYVVYIGGMYMTTLYMKHNPMVYVSSNSVYVAFGG